MWVLNFMQERFYVKGPGDFDNMFIKAEDSETKEGLRVGEATGERLGRALCFGSLETL